MDTRSSYYEFIHAVSESRPNEWFEGSQRHHILPRCLGGKDEESNLIYLTFKEHFTAHRLLAEENPGDYKLSYALWRMANSRENCTPEEYEYARSRYQKSVSIHLKGNTHGRGNLGRIVSEDSKKKMSLAHAGIPLSDETRRKMSLSRVGEGNSFYGKKHSEETKMKMSLSKKGKKKKTPIEYHLVCKSCGNPFIGRCSRNRYCSTCKSILEV